MTLKNYTDRWANLKKTDRIIILSSLVLCFGFLVFIINRKKAALLSANGQADRLEILENSMPSNVSLVANTIQPYKIKIKYLRNSSARAQIYCLIMAHPASEATPKNISLMAAAIEARRGIANCAGKFTVPEAGPLSLVVSLREGQAKKASVTAGVEYNVTGASTDVASTPNSTGH